MVIRRWWKRHTLRAEINDRHGHSAYKRAFLLTAAIVGDSAALIYHFVAADRASVNEEWTDPILTAIAIIVLATLGSWLVLPLALRHVPREYDPAQSYPGSPATLIAAVAYLATAGLNPLRLSLAIVFISLTSRGSLRWSFTGTLVLTTSLLVRLYEPSFFDMPGPATAALLLLWSVFILPGLVFGLARANRRERQSKILAQAQRAQEDITRLQDQARQEERDNIARNMHDSLSHRLSLISVYAGGLKYNTTLDPTTIQQSAATIQEEAERAVQDLRSVLQTLRFDDRVDPRATLYDLVDRARASGARVALRFDDPATADTLDALPTILVHTLGYAVQEGLTNARKHAPGKKSIIDVATRPGGLTVTMSNRMPAQDSASPSGGYGLIGLEERARLVGAGFTVDSSATDFSWTLTLPTHTMKKEK